MLLLLAITNIPSAHLKRSPWAEHSTETVNSTENCPWSVWELLFVETGNWDAVDALMDEAAAKAVQTPDAVGQQQFVHQHFLVFARKVNIVAAAAGLRPEVRHPNFLGSARKANDDAASAGRRAWDLPSCFVGTWLRLRNSASWRLRRCQLCAYDTILHLRGHAEE